MSLTFAPDNTSAIPLHVIAEDALDAWLADQPDALRTWVGAAGFTGALGRVLLVPDDAGTPRMALAGYGTPSARARGRFHLAACAAALPEGTYRLEGLQKDQAGTEALGWLLSHYAFDRYRSQNPAKARLIAPEGVDAGRIEVIAAGEALTRDLINTPASDLGPDALEAACATIAGQHGADIKTICGPDLLQQNFPLIHTVGRAAETEPRLIDMHWGDSGSMH